MRFGFTKSPCSLVVNLDSKPGFSYDSLLFNLFLPSALSQGAAGETCDSSYFSPRFLGVTYTGAHSCLPGTLLNTWYLWLLSPFYRSRNRGSAHVCAYCTAELLHNQNKQGHAGENWGDQVIGLALLLSLVYGLITYLYTVSHKSI